MIAAQSIDDHEDDQWVASSIDAHPDARFQVDDYSEGH
jgi:hypothetical protein